MQPSPFRAIPPKSSMVPEMFWSVRPGHGKSRLYLGVPFWGLLVAGATNPGYASKPAPGVGTADTMIKLPRADNRHSAIRWHVPVRVELARGEFESAQIFIAAPDDRPLRKVTVELTALRQDAAGRLREWPADSISLWRVGYVEVFNLWAPHNNLGWQPDPLLPLNAPFDVAAAGPAGLYRGEVIVRPENAPAARLPIEVRLWDFTVPGQLHWGMSYWGEANIAGRDGKKWPDVPWDTKVSRAGDGYLVYPAAGGAGVWPSIRRRMASTPKILQPIGVSWPRPS